MEGLLPLAVLLGASGSLLAYHRKARREAQGFQDLVAPGVEQALGSAHADFIRKSAEKYNPLVNIMDPLKNPIVAENANPASIADAERQVRAVVQTAQAKPSATNYDLVATNVSDILLNKSAEGSGIRRITQCEKRKTDDCNAFDDPAFARDCGICLENGRDSGGNPMVGGLFSIEDDRLSNQENAKRMNSRRTNYTPTVGSCAPYRFATTKEQCQKIKAQLECLRKQNFEVPGCSSCFQDEKFYFVENGFVKSQPALFVQGQGKATLKRSGYDDKKFDLTGTPTRFEMSGLDEGDSFVLYVEGEDSFVSGYLEGTTPSGVFRVDIIRVIQSDTITGSRPRLAGMQDINGENMSLIRPGRGKSEISLAMLNPFTFIEPTDEDAKQCPSAPFVTKETSANFLNSSPCYKKGQGPGKYSLECLQQTFESAGCTAQGTAYPSNQERAQALMVDGFGKLKSIGQIAQRVYEASLAAATGKTKDGQQLSIEQWSAESVFCTGKEIKSPCDVSDPKGNISTDCLSYLWNNSGAYQTVAGGPGQTYTNGIATTSLNEKNQNRYCTSDGTMAPIAKNGMPNLEAIRIARGKGDINQIKTFYDNIHKRANDNALDIIQRKDAIQQCYGVSVSETATADARMLDIGDKAQYVSVLDDRAGRTKSGAIKKNYTPVPAGVLPIYVLGPRGMGPWGNDWGFLSQMPQSDAKWISPLANANYNSPYGYVAAMQKTFINDTNTPIFGKLYCITDNYEFVYVNNTKMGPHDKLSRSSDESLNIYYVNLLPGENLIYVEAVNTGGPSGFIATCIDNNSGRVLFVSDNSWQGLNRAIFNGR